MKKMVSIALVAFLSSCGVKDAVEDVQNSVAIKDVVVMTDTVTVEPVLPAMNKPFADLLAEDSATYGNPASYGLKITHTLNADNTKEGAKNAQFNGANIFFVSDTANSDTVIIENDGFYVPAGQTITDNSSTEINGASERITCSFVFSRMAEGDPIEAIVSGNALWELGSENGAIPFPNAPVTIMTNASPDTKEFLKGVIGSGIFNDSTQQ